MEELNNIEKTNSRFLPGELYLSGCHRALIKDKPKNFLGSIDYDRLLGISSTEMIVLPTDIIIRLSEEISYSFVFVLNVSTQTTGWLSATARDTRSLASL